MLNGGIALVHHCKKLHVNTAQYTITINERCTKRRNIHRNPINIAEKQTEAALNLAEECFGSTEE